MPVSATARNVANSGDWVDGAHFDRCPVALVHYDSEVSTALESAAWVEGRGSLSDIVENPTVGLLAALQALKAEFSILKRKTQESALNKAKASGGK